MYRSIVLIAFGMASPANAQLVDKLVDSTTPASAEGAQYSVSLSLAPALGKSKPFNENDDLIDESSSELSAKASFPFAKYTRFELVPGITYSPQLFDDGDPKSSLFAQAGFQTRLAVGSAPTDALSDELTGFLRYKYARGYLSFLDDYASSDHGFSIGATYQNALWLYCVTSECKGDSDKKGPAVEISPSIAFTASPTADRRRWTPAISAKLSVPTRFGLTPFATVGYEHRAYTEAQAVPGTRRNDDKLTVDAGFAMSRKIDAKNEVKLSIAGRFQQNWSNLADQSYDRFYVVPSITFVAKVDERRK